jgi:hypothetical protein
MGSCARFIIIADTAETAIDEGDSLSRRVLRRARTAAGLPARVVAVEDRTSAIELHVAEVLDAMRADIAELRRLISAQIDADADASELLGQLLRSSEHRLEAIETQIEREQLPTARPRLAGGATRT